MNWRTANNHRRARERWEREGYWRRQGVVRFIFVRRRKRA